MSLMADIIRLTGQLAVRQITRRIREGRVTPGTNKAGRTLVKRGLLLRSIKNTQRGNSVVISAGGADVPYARLHHEGGIVKARRAQYLAIPLTPKAALYNARDYPGETFIKKGIIFEKDGDRIVPVYVLKKQVIMPARPYMYLDDGDRKALADAVAGEIKRRWKE